MSVLICILTTEKIDKLERCINSVIQQTNPKNIAVIINTLDTSYATQAQALSNTYGINSVVTESNGKPGKGKNALIKYFLSTDFTHVIPVDGDDILLPNAVEKLTLISKEQNADIVGLINGLILFQDEQMIAEDWLKHEMYVKRVLDNIEPKNYKKFNLHIAKIRRASVEYDNFFNRFVLISKNAALCMNYDEELAGAEDIKQGLLLKLLNHSGKLNYLLLSSQHIYLYDVTDLGVFFNTICKSDPNLELKRFWHDLSNEQINILRSVQLECIYD